MCPKGDDPLTIKQKFRRIRLEIQSTNARTFEGEVGIKFQGVVSWLGLGGPSSASCRIALETADTFGDVGCDFTSTGSFYYTFDITFYNWPDVPFQNNLFSHSGNPLISEFSCDISNAVQGVRCLFSDLVNSSLIGEWHHILSCICAIIVFPP